MNMYPNWLIVEYAKTFLMSFCIRPIVAAKNAVPAPIHTTALAEMGAMSNRKAFRAIMYTPAVTIVAAWISALTGVGPAIASGSQTNSGICADLPVAPRSRRRVTAVATPVIASD